MTKFNLTAALALAESGDAPQWEQIARHLLAAKKPSKSRKSAAGPQTWAHVILTDGREFLTSTYAKADEAATLAAHRAAAQFRARMEDSGDKGELQWDGRGVFLKPDIKPVPVKLVSLIDDASTIERVRDHCFRQRGFRQGWIGQYDRDNQPEAERAQEAA